MLPYTGFGIPLVAFNAVTNLETSSVGTGAPVLAAGASTASNKVFNSIKGDGTTTEVTLAPLLTGGDITVACTSNMLDKTTDQTIDSIKTFTKNPVVTNNAGDTGVIVNHIGAAGTGVGFAVAQDSASRIELGYNPTSTETYLWSKGAIDLKIATNNTERLRIKGTGVAVDNAGTPLAIVGTTLCKKDNLLSSTGYAAYYLSAPQTLNNLVVTTVGYDASFATDSGITNSPNGTFTINTTGLYTFSASVDFILAASGGLRAMWFELNGGAVRYCLVLTSGYATFDTAVNSTFTAKLTAGDVINVKVVQSSGGLVNLVGYSSSGGTSMCMIQITRVS